MASLLSQLIIKIGADIAPMDKALASATRKLQGFSRDITSVGSTLAVGISAPLIAMGAAAINATSELGALRAGLVAIAGSTGEAEKQMKRLQEIAKLPGLGLPEAVQGSVRLQAIGYQAAEAERILKVFGNAIATVGGGRAELAGVITQLQQMGAKSKVTADDLKPIINNVPMVGKVLKQLYGTIDSEAIQKMGIAPKQLIGDVLTQLEKLSPVAGGLKNALENFRDSATQTFDKIGTALTPFVEKFLNEFASPALESLSKMAAGFARLPSPVQDAVVAFTSLIGIAPLVTVGLAKIVESVAILSSVSWVPAGVVGAVMAAAVAIGFLVNALNNYGGAANGLREANATAEASHLRLRDALMTHKNATREHTQEVRNLYDQYKSGAITEIALMNRYKEIGFELGPKVAASLNKIGQSAAQTAEELSKYNKKMNMISDAWEAAGKRAQETADFWETAGIKALESSTALIRSTTQLGDTYTKAHDAMRAAGLQQIELTWELNAAQTMTLQRGLEVMRGYRQFVDVDAWAASTRGAKNLKLATELWGRTGKDASKEMSRAMQEVSTIVNDLARDIAQSIIHWKGFGEVVKKTAQSIGESILRNITQELIRASGIVPKLTNLVIELANKVLHALGLTAQLSKVGVPGAGGGANPANIPISYPGGGAPMPGGGSPGGAAGSAGGMMGAVNMITGIATAVSSIIGNFQMAGMNKSLDLIEKEVRYSQIHLLHLLEKANEFWPWSKFSHDRLGTMVTQGIGVYNAPGDQGVRVIGSGGSGGVNVTINGGMIFAPGGNRQFIDWMVGELRLAGAIR